MEIQGIVTEVIKNKITTRELVNFNVKQPNGTVVNLTAYFYLPIRKNDSIYAICNPSNTNAHEINSVMTIKSKNPTKTTKKYTITTQPMVMIDTTNDTNLVHHIKIGLDIEEFGKAKAFLQELKNNHISNVYEHMQMVAEDWHRHHDNGTLVLLGLNNQHLEVEKLLRYWYIEFNQRQLHLLGLTNKEIKKISDLTTKLIFDQCITNPYVISSLSLVKTQKICNTLNLVVTDDQVMCGKIVRYIYECLDLKKWMCVKMTSIMQKFPTFTKLKSQLINEYHIHITKTHVYLRTLYNIEKHVADFVVRMLKMDPVTNMYDPLNTFYKGKNNEEFIRYPVVCSATASADQKIAIQAAMDHTFVLIVGKPGCGKTQTIAEIVHNLILRDLKFIVTSFTGRSIERVREVLRSTNTQANIATMHRLIHDARKGNIADLDMVIIDEVSMVTTDLFYQFITYFGSVKQYVLVGDVNQLPPIEHGSLLQELLKSSLIPMYQLTQNHRVENVENDGILHNIYNIANHQPSAKFQFVESDNFIISVGNIQTVLNIVKQFKEMNITSDELTIISPYKKHLKILNEGYQSIYNSQVRQVRDQFQRVWKVDDKVMLCKNVSTKNIFNGQQGRIVDISKEGLMVDFHFSGKHLFALESKYKHQRVMEDEEDEDHDSELTVKKLQHAYCLTTHKAQGSESDYIIIYIDSDYDQSSFLNRNLLYTAISRAKRFVWIVTTKQDLLNDAIQRSVPYRCENLGLVIKEEMKKNLVI